MNRSFLGRHARVCGAVLAVLAGIGLFFSVDLRHLARPGLRGEHRAFLFWPILLSTGLYVLATGMPAGADGQPPAWWRRGLAIVAILAGAVGLAFSYAR